MTTVSELGRTPQILLIDDNRGDAMLIKRAFKGHADVIIEGSAEGGLAVLRGGTIRPDIVLLDLNLPAMTGLTLLNLVKSDPNLRMIPVIVMSSSRAEKDVAASYASHANGFVTKPFSLDAYESFVAAVSSYWFMLVESPPELV